MHLMKITERRGVVDILHLRDRGYYYAVIIARRLQVNPKSKEHPFVLFVSKYIFFICQGTERGYSGIGSRAQLEPTTRRPEE